MAYTINSAHDSLGDEQTYVNLFNQHAIDILRYRTQHGGDLEGAFQAVVGKPWPAGRSVKLHNGAAEMTKDRTVKSVLGKYVAPIAAGIAAPFAFPALLGGGGGAAAASPLAATGAASAGSGAGVATGTAAASTIPGSLAATSAALPSTILGNSVIAPTVASSLAGTGTLGTTAGGLLARVGGSVGRAARGGLLSDVGSAIGDATNAAGNNRLSADEIALQAKEAYEQELNARAKTDADQRNQAAKDAYRASYFSGQPTTQGAYADNNPLRPMNNPTPELVQMLNSLGQQGTARLAQPSPYNMNTVDPLTMNRPTPPSTLERVGSWAAPAATILSRVARYF